MQYKATTFDSLELHVSVDNCPTRPPPPPTRPSPTWHMNKITKESKGGPDSKLGTLLKNQRVWPVEKSSQKAIKGSWLKNQTSWPLFEHPKAAKESWGTMY